MLNTFIASTSKHTIDFDTLPKAGRSIVRRRSSADLSKRELREIVAGMIG